jgi:hypothetical protein
MGVYSLWWRRRSRRGGNRCIELKAKQAKAETNQDEQAAGLYTGTYAEIASTKRGHMDRNGFEDIITEFAPKFEELKQLAQELRNILFPIKGGAIFTVTFLMSQATSCVYFA